MSGRADRSSGWAELSSGRADRRSASAEGSRGFTLLETMVAVLVLGLAVVATLQLLSGVTAATEKNRSHSRARALAAGELETMLSGDPSALPGRDGASGRFAPPFEAYRYRLGVRPAQGGGLLELRVRVSWETGGGGEVTLATRAPAGPAAVSTGAGSFR